MKSEPELRASLLKLYLERLPHVLGEDSAKVRDELGADAILRIERASASAWLPIAIEVALLRAVERLRGDDGVREVGRDVGLAATNNAILRPLVSAMLGMLGRRPDVLVQLAVAGWGLATRNAGRLRIASRVDGEVRIELFEIPEAMRDRALFLRMCGSIEALFAHGGVRAQVELDGAPEAPRIGYTVKWSRGRRASAARR